MANSKLNFNGGWNKGHAAHAVGVKLTQKTHVDKSKYNRKAKYPKNTKCEY